MKILFVTCWICLLFIHTIQADPNDLEGGVFIAHHPPGLQYTGGQDWCQRYFEEFALTDCQSQNNRIDIDGDDAGSVWYVIAAWNESKQFCGIQFGLGDYNSNIYEIVDSGACLDNVLEVPTTNWPGPNEGVAAAATDSIWSGNIVPIYYFAGYAYGTGIIPLSVDPSDGNCRVGNCLSPSEAWNIQGLGGMGIFRDGTYECPTSTTSVRVCCIDEVCYLDTSVACTQNGGDWFSELYTCDGNPCVTSAPQDTTTLNVKLVYSGTQ